MRLLSLLLCATALCNLPMTLHGFQLLEQLQSPSQLTVPLSRLQSPSSLRNQQFQCPRPLSPLFSSPDDDLTHNNNRGKRLILAVRRALTRVATFRVRFATAFTKLPRRANVAAIVVVPAEVLRQRNQKSKKDLNDLKDELKELDLKEETTPDSSNDGDEDNNKKTRCSTLEKQAYEEGILFKPIGTVNSIYRLCVGTPRQGLLAPDARGRIRLIKFGGDAVIGLEGFSHIWVLFCFHHNTQSKNSKRVKTKVAPPALGGKKVGILATRTPHRFNPIGMTLCKLDKIEKKNNEVVLHVSGLDLVDGTPVFDIKPYVPFYDSVDVNNIKLPPWVPEGLSMQRNVTFTQLAQDELKDLLQKDPDALQFYGKKHGDMSLEGTVDVVTECIRQVLAADVRSSHQTKKARDGKFQAERSARLEDKDAAQAPIQNMCTQQLDNLLIQYTVTEAADRQYSQSEGSGAEDAVSVKSITLLKTKEKAESTMKKDSEEIPSMPRGN
jgi:tRNA-Thr(GGU) m(6)t(6)A37 methyltransferase TsaA